MSKKLNEHFSSQPANSEMIDKLYPSNINAEFRDRLSSILQGESESTVCHPALKASIVEWNKKIISCSGGPNKDIMLAAANDDFFNKVANG